MVALSHSVQQVVSEQLQVLSEDPLEDYLDSQLLNHKEADSLVNLNNNNNNQWVEVSLANNNPRISQLEDSSVNNNLKINLQEVYSVNKLNLKEEVFLDNNNNLRINQLAGCLDNNLNNKNQDFLVSQLQEVLVDFSVNLKLSNNLLKVEVSSEL